MLVGNCMTAQWRKEIKMMTIQPLIDIESCSLHVVHGALRSGVQRTKWGIMVYSKPCTTCLMHPLQKDYQNITGSKVFPLPFCGYRWIEDKKLQIELLMFGPTLLRI